jgi:hypothetical protein
MDPSLKARLLQAKQSLNQWYEQLNRTWQEAEDLLLSIHLGREVAVLLYDEDPGTFGHYHPEREGWNNADSIESDGWSHYLAVTKRLGDWRLCYVSVPTGYDWDNDWVGEWKPIRECTKEIRVEAANDLPKLLAAVVAEAEKFGSEVEAAVGTLKEAVAPFKDLSGR